MTPSQLGSASQSGKHRFTGSVPQELHADTYNYKEQRHSEREREAMDIGSGHDVKTVPKCVAKQRSHRVKHAKRRSTSHRRLTLYSNIEVSTPGIKQQQQYREDSPQHEETPRVDFTRDR
jgi:hypothetical protein